MTDVFISFSRLDAERAQPIAERLGSLGYAVARTGEGQARVDEIEREFATARAVLIVWTESARHSPWVLALAARALDENKLLQMQIDSARTPAPFDALPIADMSGGKSEWGKLEDALARLVREGRAPEALARVGAGNVTAIAGAPRLILVASVAALAACATAVTAAFNGVMAADQLQWTALGVMAVGGLCAAIAAQRLFATRRAGG